LDETIVIPSTVIEYQVYISHKSQQLLARGFFSLCKDLNFETFRGNLNGLAIFNIQWDINIDPVMVIYKMAKTS